MKYPLRNTKNFIFTLFCKIIIYSYNILNEILARDTIALSKI